MPGQDHYDVIVVGGGACGSTTAYFLALEGLSVALLDKGAVGMEASWASAGMIGAESCPLRDPWFLAATTLSRKLYDRLEQELCERTGRRVGYGGEGHMLIARAEDELDELHERARVQNAAGVTVEILDGADTRAREPAVPQDVLAAAWSPGGRYLDARQYTKTVAIAAEGLGVKIFEGCPVNALERRGDRVVGVRCGHDRMFAGTVINAAGAWAGRIDPQLAHPVFPLHGQIMSVAAAPCGLRHNLSRAGRWGYATPRPDGRIVVGATHDEWGFHRKVTPEGMAYLGNIVEQLIPILVGQPVLDVWTGLRPGTIDGLPTIGADPRFEGGYLWAAGHSSSGMMQMPATARVLVDLVLDRAPSLPIDQLRIERYDQAESLVVAEPLKSLEKRFPSI